MRSALSTLASRLRRKCGCPSPTYEVRGGILTCRDCRRPAKWDQTTQKNTRPSDNPRIVDVKAVHTSETTKEIESCPQSE